MFWQLCLIVVNGVERCRHGETEAGQWEVWDCTGRSWTRVGQEGRGDADVHRGHGQREKHLRAPLDQMPHGPVAP